MLAGGRVTQSGAAHPLAQAVSLRQLRRQMEVLRQDPQYLLVFGPFAWQSVISQIAGSQGLFQVLVFGPCLGLSGMHMFGVLRVHPFVQCPPKGSF